jgi:hypothetical protein
LVDGYLSQNPSGIRPPQPRRNHHHSWGDDENQSSDVSKNFTNPSSTAAGRPGDAYGDIPGGDIIDAVELASAFRCTHAVRGKDYSVEQA